MPAVHWKTQRNSERIEKVEENPFSEKLSCLGVVKEPKVES